MELTIYCACDKVSVKNPKAEGSENFWVGEQTHPCTGRVAHPNFMGTEDPAQGPFWTSPFVPLYLAVHLSPLSYSLLHNKLVNVNVSPVLLVVPANDWTRGGDLGTFAL